MRTPHWIAACTVAALAGLALPATAAPHGHEAAHKAAPVAKAHEAREAHEADKSKGHEAPEAKGNEAREAAGDHGKAEGKNEDNGKDKGKKEGEDQKGPPEAVQKKLEQLRATRKERRAARLAEIRHHWGAIVAEPAVRAELKVHAWRMARLDRIRELADAEGKKDIVARVDKLITKENARHEKHMGVLKSAGGPK